MTNLNVTICKYTPKIKTLLLKGFAYKIKDGFAVIIRHKSDLPILLELKKINVSDCLHIIEYSFIDQYHDVVIYHDLKNDIETRLDLLSNPHRATQIGLAKIGAGAENINVLQYIRDSEDVLTEQQRQDIALENQAKWESEQVETVSA